MSWKPDGNDDPVITGTNLVAGLSAWLTEPVAVVATDGRVAGFGCVGATRGATLAVVTGAPGKLRGSDWVGGGGADPPKSEPKNPPPPAVKVVDDPFGAGGATVANGADCDPAFTPATAR